MAIRHIGVFATNTYRVGNKYNFCWCGWGFTADYMKIIKSLVLIYENQSAALWSGMIWMWLVNQNMRLSRDIKCVVIILIVTELWPCTTNSSLCIMVTVYHQFFVWPFYLTLTLIQCKTYHVSMKKK